MPEKQIKTKFTNAGKELARFTSTWGKGKRAREMKVVIKVCDAPLPDEQVTKEFAKILAPVVLKIIREKRARE